MFGAALGAALLGCTTGEPARVSSGLARLPNVSVAFVGQKVSDLPLEGDVSGTRVVLCLKEIRFLSASGGRPFAVELGSGPSEVVISEDLYEVAVLTVPPGEYAGVSLITSTKCGLGPTQVENARGQFTHGREMELPWRFKVVVSALQTRVWLPTRPLLAAASRIDRSLDVADTLWSSLDAISTALQVAKLPGLSESPEPVRAQAALPLSGVGRGAR
jgi:hypothetical protein